MLLEWIKKELAEMRERAKEQQAFAASHCGACAHNCSLNNPGCGVGREAAARKGVEIKKPAED